MIATLPLKILHILDHSLPLHSGYTFRTANILQAQQKQGWNPVGLTSPKHEASWNGSAPALEEIGGVKIYRSGGVGVRSLPMESDWRTMWALLRRIEEVVRIETPDILHAHSPILNGLPALWVGYRFEIPVVYEIRAFWEDAAVDHGTYGENSWKYRTVKRLETETCRRADQVAVICEGLKADLVRRGIPREKISIIPNGVDASHFSENGSAADLREQWKIGARKVVGFVGSFYHYEGLDLLIDAFATLCKGNDDLRLLLVGGGQEAPALLNRIKSQGIEEKVILPGRVPHSKIAEVYSLIDVLAFPRHSMRLTELVTPLKPLEAMVMGKPIVASDVGGHRELIQHGQTGLLVPPGDKTALAEALKTIIENDVLRRSMAENAKTWVKVNRPWEVTTAGYSELYGRAMSRGIKET